MQIILTNDRDLIACCPLQSTTGVTDVTGVTDATGATDVTGVTDVTDNVRSSL